MESHATQFHFAGLNTAQLAEALEGEDVLISYADVIRRPGVWKREIRPRLEAGRYGRVILDSGAFTVISTPGFTVDVKAYGRFALEHCALFDVVVNLDDIAGDLATTHRNQKHLESLGLDVMPVFHQGEPWELLAAYCEQYPEIGVGFARKPGGKLVGGCEAFLTEFFDSVPDGIRVHGFGMTRWALKGFPFATVDSTTWIAEYRALQGDFVETTGRKDGCRGGLRARIRRLGRGGILRLVIRSYRERGGRTLPQVEHESAGQARTVLRRFDAAALVAALANPVIL